METLHGQHAVQPLLHAGRGLGGLLRSLSARARRWPLQVAAARARWRAQRDCDAVYAALAHLPADTLRDIGAPAWVHEHGLGSATSALDRVRW